MESGIQTAGMGVDVQETIQFEHIRTEKFVFSK
jgi:hypothetical protein